jgi:Spx/MgsR family transcriptional regulator
MASTKRKRASTGKEGRKVRFLHKPNCTTCRKASKALKRRGFQLYFRDLAKERLTSAEIENLIGNRDYKDFLNSRNELFRRKKMRDSPPSRREAIRLMAEEPNLIRRPVIVAGGHIVIGFDKDGIARL